MDKLLQKLSADARMKAAQYHDGVIGIKEAHDAANALWGAIKTKGLTEEDVTKKEFVQLMDGVIVTPEMFYDLWKSP